MAGVTIPGASGLPPIVFTITGTSALNQATAFQNALLAEGQTLTAVDLTSGGTESTMAGALNEITSGGTLSTFTLSTGDQYTVVDTGSSVTLTGSAAGGDSVLGGGSLFYVAVGDNNMVTFADGANVYQGDSSSGDVITGGSGYDAINAGTGSNNTVFSGSGHDTIFLGDTGPGGDIAFLGDGQSTVISTGLADTIAAEAPGQLIFIQGPATASDLITIQPDSVGDLGNDTIVLGSASVSIFDSVGGNQIYGGSGNLTFIGGDGTSPVADTIVGGTGPVSIFAENGDSITLANDTTSLGDIFVAGSGNETLDGGYANGGFAFFGDTVTADTAVSTSVIGGSGTNYFSTGVGNETLDGGSGVNIFNIVDGLTAGAITINDFSAADSVSFAGDTQDQINTILDNASVSGGNLVLTLTDNTTVTFVGVTSLTGHII
jgi:hypothetical protein